MKKGFVALLIVLAIIVLISPGIVGRLAEKSMDENLDWAAAESQEVTVTSQGFDRGWFSSEGQHRVELREGEMRDTLLALAAENDVDELPVLIIDTRMDHGLVPFSSMSRDKGSLMPGLGSAVSKLSLEFGNGKRVDLPGTIYSSVGLTGNLESNLIVEPGSFTKDGETANWGGVDVTVTTSPTSAIVGFDGTIESLSGDSGAMTLGIDAIEFSGDQQQTRFGLAVGDLMVRIGSVTVPSAQGPNTVGPMSVESTAELDGDRISGSGKLRVDKLTIADLGLATIEFDATLSGADATSLGNLTRTLENAPDHQSGDELMVAVEPDLQRLLASGFEFRIDKLDVDLPQGKLETRLDLKLDESDVDSFVWTSALLALDATFDISIPEQLVAIATATNPQINAAIGMGFLQSNGNVYEMHAEFKNGLLTVNGAPMPLPIPGLQ